MYKLDKKEMEKKEKSLNYVRFHMKNNLAEFAKEVDAETMLQVLYEQVFSMEAVVCDLAGCLCARRSTNALYVPDYSKCGYNFNALKAIAKSSLRLEETPINTVA